MSRTLSLVFVVALGTSAFYPAAEACGDSFLMVDAGEVPARICLSLSGKGFIFARRSGDPKAGLNDVQLHKALRQAGHDVSIGGFEDWTLLEQKVKTLPFDVHPRGCRRGAQA